MGKYINGTSNGSVGASAQSKYDAIIADGGQPIPEPTEFVENLVCVVNNGMFGAAAYAFDEREMNAFKQPDGRPKQWLIWNKVSFHAF